jgi:hypothetical protein
MPPATAMATSLLAAALVRAEAATAPPPANMLAFQRLATTQFMHFSMCTFHDCEQDERHVYPATSFAPTGRVDTDQWLEVASSWGAKQVCLTAHHSGGFALWQTNTTDYGVRQSPYRNGSADIVRDFVASCRKFNVSPCLYFIPAEDGRLEQQNRTADQYFATQLAMLRELLTRYGPIDRVWFDFWGDDCGRFGSGCPKGALNRQGYSQLAALVRELSPGTVMLPGVDGCLDDVAVENGEAAYPSWSYASPAGNPANPVVCRPVLPNSSGAVFAGHEVDQTIQNRGITGSGMPRTPTSAPLSSSSSTSTQSAGVATGYSMCRQTGQARCLRILRPKWRSWGRRSRPVGSPQAPTAHRRLPRLPRRRRPAARPARWCWRSLPVRS